MSDANKSSRCGLWTRAFREAGLLKFAAHGIDPEKAGSATAVRPSAHLPVKCCCAHVTEILIRI